MNEYRNLNKTLIIKVDNSKRYCYFFQTSSKKMLKINLKDARMVFKNIGKRIFEIKSSIGRIYIQVSNVDNFGNHHIFASANCINAYIKSSEIKKILYLLTGEEKCSQLKGGEV